MKISMAQDYCAIVPWFVFLNCLKGTDSVWEPFYFFRDSNLSPCASVPIHFSITPEESSKKIVSPRDWSYFALVYKPEIYIFFSDAEPCSTSWLPHAWRDWRQSGRRVEGGHRAKNARQMPSVKTKYGHRGRLTPSVGHIKAGDWVLEKQRRCNMVNSTRLAFAVLFVAIAKGTVCVASIEMAQLDKVTLISRCIPWHSLNHHPM